MAGGLRRLFSRKTVQEVAAAVTKSTPLPNLLSRQGGGQPEWNDWRTETATREGYQRSTWLYDAIELRRKAVASVPWFVEVRDENGEWQRSPDHPLQQLLDEPNPDFTPRQLFGRITQWLDLGGNAYLLKVRAGNRNVPAELWPVMPDSMAVLPGGPDTGRLVRGYRYEADNVRKDFPVEDVTHLTYPAPGSFYYGMGPVQAAGMATDIDTEAQAYQKVSLQNRGVPDGVFTLQGDAITRDEYEQAKEQVRQQYQGRDAHRAPWVVAQAQWNQMSLSPVDLDYINSRKESRTEILSALGVPPPMVGIYEEATLNNIQTARHIFWADTVVPLLEELRDALQSALVPEFGDPKRVRVMYDTSGVQALQENFDGKVQTAERLWNMGVPLNSVNQRLELGLEDIPGGDVGYIPAAKVPATNISAGAGDESDEAAAGEADEEDAGITLSESQVQTILAMIQQIARGELPRSSAVELIAGAFDVSADDAEAIVGDVEEGSAANDEANAGDEARGVSVEEVKTQARERMSYRGMGTVEDLARMAYGGGS